MKDHHLLNFDSDQSSVSDFKPTWTTTPNRMNTEVEGYSMNEIPNKKRLSGYLVQKHIKRKNTRNNVSKLWDGDQTFFNTELTFENLCKLDISSSPKKIKPNTKEIKSIKTSFLNKTEGTVLLSDFNRTISFPNKFEEGKLNLDFFKFEIQI